MPSQPPGREARAAEQAHPNEEARLGPGPAGRAMAEALAGLELSRWEVARDLLMVRLLTAERWGPLVRPLGPDIGFDVSLAVTTIDRGRPLEGAVRVGSELTDGWGCGPDVIWRTALANTGRLAVQPRGRATAGGIDVTLVSAGLFTTGIMARFDHFAPRLGLAPETAFETVAGPECCHWLSAIDPSTVAVFQAVGQGRGQEPPVELRNDLAALAERPMPFNLLRWQRGRAARLDVEGSFTSVRILE